ncbi:hypothetical protein ROZALSC1DRAFT_30434 [Rozella allomycis CSF55]|uniref:DNA mismatch repair proteins mutS family domain-containing protein n=1 Tax=Rozella allomycis (strain CSF55) TaxID=988480 RepID=A0A4P9YF72_ROZAC|nr:hypothetical protein ROZALSC1DRAFT_30434 [Rozella allomycis CSF55]
MEEDQEQLIEENQPLEADVKTFKETFEDIVLCIYFSEEWLTAAYIDLFEKQAYMLPLFSVCEGIDNVVSKCKPLSKPKLVIMTVGPTIILVSEKLSRKNLQCVRTSAKDNLNSFNIFVRPESDFVCNEKLIEYLHEKWHDKLCDIDEKCIQTLCCVASFVCQNYRLEDLEGNQIDFNTWLSDVCIFKLATYMYVSKETLEDLQIFENEYHPASHIGGQKEGISLFGLFVKHIVTAGGKKTLKKWMQRPLTDLGIINKRLESVKIIRENIQSFQRIKDFLKLFSMVCGVLKKLKDNAKCSYKEYQLIIKFCKLMNNLIYSKQVGEFKGLEGLKSLNVLLEMNPEIFQDVITHVEVAIDFDLSKIEDRVVINVGIDEELAHLRQTFDNLPDFLLNVVYYPQFCYLICIQLEPHIDPLMDYSMYGLEFQFSTENAIYFKHQRMHELDSYLGDLHSAIIDKELEILTLLNEGLLSFGNEIENFLNVVYELDCLMAFAATSIDLNLGCPIINDSDDLQIINGFTFLIDVNQVSNALKQLTPKSLLLLDEFGKGTNSNDGISLVCGLIEYLSSSTPGTPRTIAITHFHEIKKLNLLENESKICWKTTKTIVQEGNEQSLVFLYKIIDGESENSWGLYCAKLAGIPDHILDSDEYNEQEDSVDDVLNALNALEVPFKESLFEH